MVKRKREAKEQAAPAAKSRKSEQEKAPRSQEAAANNTVTTSKKQTPTSETTNSAWVAETTIIQIVTGSYERVLHGFTAAIPSTLITKPSPEPTETVTYTDNFLFNAHTSSIRCLALSPPTDDPNGRILLASGSTDERINIYSLSLCPLLPKPNNSTAPSLPFLSKTAIATNPKNKELGSLTQHASSITALCFPSRSKLLSSSEDSTIAITRTRDWEHLSSIKVPIPTPQGRPSGDTAAPGEVPSGVNDFAVHPSNRLMLSVSKGEKSMRLWNLVTGKKAGVLSFSREDLSAVGEGRMGTGEGRRVLWDPEGEEFTVGFERGAIVFGIDCKPRATIIPTPRTKIHQMAYLPAAGERTVLALSTEDGRIMFYDTGNTVSAPASQQQNGKEKDAQKIGSCVLISQLGGPAAGITSRIKDFSIIPIPSSESSTTAEKYLIVSACSDGSVRLWVVDSGDVLGRKKKEDKKEKMATTFTTNQVGRLIGTYANATRITCLKAFVMTGKPEEGEVGVGAREDGAKESESESEESSEEDEE
ncbi:WD40 repeat-like protein [Sporormia fimetaria CBS 119925]|uniref:WD40 repeat-like protein n=1 Tax=Sporormia fimetaria CBS 119925 TaxID=1340428 RepID=A0A6A6VJP1_9PLEO|nr:WD40 repeat-like protein [Sporormia fimetaria CBS 119925]